MIEFLIKKPIAVIMCFLAFGILGLVSFDLLPKSLMPSIDIPVISIYVDEEQYSANDLDKLVLSPIRKQLLQVPGLENIESKISDGQGIIELKFDFGTNINYSFIEVNEKIDQVISSLPKDVDRPNVLKLNPINIPVFNINIPYPRDERNSLLSFSYFIKNVVKKRIEQLPSVAFVDITGLIYPEIFIIPDEKKCSSLNITQNDIQKTIEDNNIQMGSFKIKDGHYQYDILFEPTLTSIDDIEKLLINVEGKLIPLKNIAEIGIREKQRKGYFLNNNYEALSLSVIQKSNAKISNLKQEVDELFNQIKEEYPDINYNISQDQSSLLNYSINSLKQSVGIGAILAFLIILSFIKNYRLSIIIGVTIPITIVISFFFFYLLNISINIISLSGVIIGVGMMVDNSIIVIDNISQYRSSGKSIIIACVIGTQEMIRPLLSSLLTTCVVFIPLIFLSGIAGALFYDQAIAIVISLSVSYLVSIILLPTLYKLFKISINKYSDGIILSQLYTKGFEVVFANKKITLIFSFLILMLSILGIFTLKKEKLPFIEYNDFYLMVNWNEEISIEENKKRTKEIISFLSNKQGVEMVNSYIGEDQYIIKNNQSADEFGVKIFVKCEPNTKLNKIKDKSIDYIKNKYHNAIYSIQNTENIFESIFNSNSPSLVLKVMGTNEDTVNLITQEINRNLPNVNILKNENRSIIEIQLNSQKIALYNVDQISLIDKLQILLGIKEIGVLKETNEFVPIVLSSKRSEFNNKIENSFITNRNDIEIPIHSLISLKMKKGSKYLFADSDASYIPIILETKVQKEAVNYIKKNFNDKNIKIEGTYFEHISFFYELIVVFIIAMILLYFVLATQFESLIQPFIILAEIPISLSGAIVFLLLFNQTLNIMSLIGIIIMIGIVINDSILKIDTINQLIKNEEMSIKEAIHKAGIKRLNAILMTSLTTIMAMIPILFTNNMGSNLQKPLAFAVIGSMIVGTLVSLYFVPLLYWVVYQKYDKVQKYE